MDVDHGERGHLSGRSSSTGHVLYPIWSGRWLLVNITNCLWSNYGVRHFGKRLRASGVELVVPEGSTPAPAKKY